MEPIINPWLFYLASIVDGIRTVCITIGIVIGIIEFILFLFMSMDDGWGYLQDGDEEYVLVAKWLKRLLVVFLIIIGLIIFIPNKQTIYQMIIFNNITVDNVNMGIDKVKELIDFTVIKIGGLK